MSLADLPFPPAPTATAAACAAYLEPDTDGYACARIQARTLSGHTCASRYARAAEKGRCSPFGLCVGCPAGKVRHSVLGAAPARRPSPPSPRRDPTAPGDPDDRVRELNERVAARRAAEQRPKRTREPRVLPLRPMPAPAPATTTSPPRATTTTTTPAPAPARTEGDEVGRETTASAALAPAAPAAEGCIRCDRPKVYGPKNAPRGEAEEPFCGRCLDVGRQAMTRRKQPRTTKNVVEWLQAHAAMPKAAGRGAPAEVTKKGGKRGKDWSAPIELVHCKRHGEPRPRAVRLVDPLPTALADYCDSCIGTGRTGLRREGKPRTPEAIAAWLDTHPTREQMTALHRQAVAERQAQVSAPGAEPRRAVDADHEPREVVERAVRDGLPREAAETLPDGPLTLTPGEQAHGEAIVARTPANGIVAHATATPTAEGVQVATSLDGDEGPGLFVPAGASSEPGRVAALLGGARRGAGDEATATTRRTAAEDAADLARLVAEMVEHDRTLADLDERAKSVWAARVACQREAEALHARLGAALGRGEVARG